jgi:hypothetical protein
MDMTVKETRPVPGGLFMELSRTLQMRRRELDRYLMEQDTWIEGMKFLLSGHSATGRPWPCYRDEHSVWL